MQELKKNMGPAGTTLVVIKEDILGEVSRKIPSMLNYKVHLDKDSMYNTPSVYAVCPVDCCVPDEDNVETEEELLAKQRFLHSEGSALS